MRLPLGGLFECRIGGVHIMLQGYRWRVTQPLGHYRQRERLGQVRFAACAQVVPHAGPRGAAGAADHLAQRSAQVAAPPASRALGAFAILVRLPLQYLRHVLNSASPFTPHGNVQPQGAFFRQFRATRPCGFTGTGARVCGVLRLGHVCLP